MISRRQVQKFDLLPKVITVASLMGLTVTNASCTLTIIIVLLQHRVGLSDDLTGAISMVILTSLAWCFMVVTMKTKLGIMWYSYELELMINALSENQKASGSKELYSMKLIESTSEFIIPILTDIPRAIIQLDTIILQETYSPTLISSLVLLVFSIGGALKMTTISSLLCECLEYQHIPIIGHFTAYMKFMCAFNPCFSATQLLRKVQNQVLGTTEENRSSKSASFIELDRALSRYSLRRSVTKEEEPKMEEPKTVTTTFINVEK